MPQTSVPYLLATLLTLVAVPVMADHGVAWHLGANEPALSSSSARAPEDRRTIADSLAQLSITGQGSPYGEFLDPDIAFVPSLEVRNARALLARWEIAEGYYLYRDKLRFRLLEPERAKLGEPRMKTGTVKEDEFFGKTEVFYERLEATLPFDQAGLNADELMVELSYQGCADAGLCYPPMTKTLRIALEEPASASNGAVGQFSWDRRNSGQLQVSEQDRIAGSLASGGVWLTVLTFYGFGLLLAFTPCVLPMVPIISGIIAGQGAQVTTRRAFLLSLVFVLAMAATYTAAGVAAGLTGANLSALFQAPWILIGFSAVFVLLALAMFGVYDLQIPTGWQLRLTTWSNRQRGGQYWGVGVMGLLSALIVGPCVAAPLAGALIYIGQTGDGVLGGLALFALSLGMGTPILAIGASAGKLLPKVGPWMENVKAGFGFVLLGVAIYLLERIIPGWAVMFLWAALLIYAAIFLGALDRLAESSNGQRRLAKGTGLILLTYGIVLLVGGAAGGNDPMQPLRGIGWVGSDRAESPPLRFKAIKGLPALERELQRARAEGRSVMLDFYADWCVTCKELEKYTFSDAQVQAVLAGTVLLRTDVTANDEQDQALLRQLGLFGPPAVLFFGADGKERGTYRMVGYMDAELFRKHARGALSS
jgi:thiol:disulfide interchange protein DsbD